MSQSRVSVLIVGSDTDARAVTMQSLEAQTVVTTTLTSGESVDRLDDGTVLLVTAGTLLDVTACEQLCWFLSTHSEAGFATTSVRGRPAPLSSVGCILDICAFRVRDARRAMGDDTWRAVGHIAAQVPEVAVITALSVLETGAAGGLMRTALVVERSGTSSLQQAEAAGQRILKELGLAESALIDPRVGALPAAPLQQLGSVSHTPVTAKPSVARGHRILALVQGFPMGGYTAFNADVLPRLVARGHEVTTCALEWWQTDWRVDRLRAVAPDVHHAPSVVPPTLLPAYVEWLIESRAIEVLYLSHCFIGYRLLPRLRARFPQLAIVDYVHTAWNETQMYGSYATMSAQWSTHIDAQIASSEALARELVELGATADRTHVAYIGIDTAQWQADSAGREAVRRALGAREEETILLFVGRVSPEKRPLLAVDALESLRARGHRVRLVVAGGGPLASTMHHMLVQRGMSDHAIMVGELDEPTLRQVYSAADVYFAPSEIEGIARALYEAMAMGCVPVVSDVGGQRELVVDGTGSLVPPQPGTIASFLPALERWLDPIARGKASAAARAHLASKFDSAHTVAALESAIVAARERSAAPRAADSPALAHEVALLAIETMRRHVLAVR
jgi:glycosyltransferase involved in cell wall biosynthesis